MQTLITLKLQKTNIGDRGAHLLSDTLLKNTVGSIVILFIWYSSPYGLLQTLTTLDLQLNKIDIVGVQCLADALIHNKVGLVIYSIMSCPFAISMQTLTQLDLSYNEFGNTDAQHLANALRHNTVRCFSTIVLYSYFTPHYRLSSICLCDQLKLLIKEQNT